MSYIINIKKKKITPVNNCNICLNNTITIKCKYCNFYICNKCRKKWFKYNNKCPHCKKIDSYENKFLKCKNKIKTRIVYFKYYCSYFLSKLFNIVIPEKLKKKLINIPICFGYSLFIILYFIFYAIGYSIIFLISIIIIFFCIYLFTCCCCCNKNNIFFILV